MVTLLPTKKSILHLLKAISACGILLFLCYLPYLYRIYFPASYAITSARLHAQQHSQVISNTILATVWVTFSVSGLSMAFLSRRLLHLG